MVPHLYRVERMMKETHDTLTLVMAPVKKGTNPPFLPGQFNMLYVFGKGEVPISISGDPSDRNTLVHTTRVVGVVTDAIGKLRRGDTIGVRGPFGSHWPFERAEGRDVLIVAGGIGLAPLRPLIYLILSRRNRYRKVSLLYGARTPADILYERELRKWRSKFDVEVHVTVDRAGLGWHGSIGVVTEQLVRVADLAPQTTTAMLCGPEIMMRFTVAALASRGISGEDTYISMERNMKCAVGFCGHCQYGPDFICKDGPVFRYSRVERLFAKREI